MARLAKTEGGRAHSNIAEVPESAQASAEHVSGRDRNTRAELIDRNDVGSYFYSQARARRFFRDLKIAFVCFPPYQNACRRAIFYAIKNLKLLRIFSRFIGFNGIFSCFFLGLHNPTAVPPPYQAAPPNQQPFPPPTTVSTYPGHYLDIVYLCLHPPAPSNEPPAPIIVQNTCHRKSPVTGDFLPDRMGSTGYFLT